MQRMKSSLAALAGLSMAIGSLFAASTASATVIPLSCNVDGTECGASGLNVVGGLGGFELIFEDGKHLLPPADGAEFTLDLFFESADLTVSQIITDIALSDLDGLINDDNDGVGLDRTNFDTNDLVAFGPPHRWLASATWTNNALLSDPPIEIHDIHVECGDTTNDCTGLNLVEYQFTTSQSFELVTASVPAPGPLALAGLGLIGIAAGARRANR